MKRQICLLPVLFLLTAVIILLSSCVEDIDVSDYVSNPEMSYDYSNDNSQTVSVSEISEDVSKPEVSEISDTTPSYTDSFFEEMVFIKCFDVSNELNYASVYKFDTNGKVAHSINMYEGFWQSTASYFKREYSNTDEYEIWLVRNEDMIETDRIFTVKDQIITSYPWDDPSSFINEDEFNTIYEYHAEWNRAAFENWEDY